MSEENKKNKEPLSQSTKRNENKEPDVLNTQGQPSAEQVDETPSSSPDEDLRRR